ncbi:MAG TPA: hypothetical protein VI072_12930 [Polyangiaceae bacterium]
MSGFVALQVFSPPFVSLARAEPGLKLDGLRASGAPRAPAALHVKVRRRVNAEQLPAVARRVELVLQNGGELPLAGTRARVVLHPGEAARTAGDLGDRWEQIHRVLAFGGTLQVDEDVALVILDARVAEARVSSGSRTFILVAPVGSTVRVVRLYVETSEPENDAPPGVPPAASTVPLERVVIQSAAPKLSAPSAVKSASPEQSALDQSRPSRSAGPGRRQSLWHEMRLEYDKLAEAEAELRALRHLRYRLSTAAMPSQELSAIDARLSALHLDLQVLWQRAGGVIGQLGRPLHARGPMSRSSPDTKPAPREPVEISDGTAERQPLQVPAQVAVTMQ